MARTYLRLAAALCVAATSAFAGTVFAPSAGWADYAAAKSRYDGGYYRQAEELWRVCAWREDEIFCQVELGNQYLAGERYTEDKVEAYVWYYLALINPSRHGISLLTAYEAFEMKAAARKELLELQKIITTEEWAQAEERLNYILSTRGAKGMVQLGEVYDEQRGGDTEITTPVRTDLNKESLAASSRVVNAIRSGFRDGGAWYTRLIRGQIGGSNGRSVADATGSSSRAVFFRRNNLQAMKYYLLAERYGQPSGILLARNIREQLKFETALMERAQQLADEWRLPSAYPGPQWDASDDVIRNWYQRNAR